MVRFFCPGCWCDFSKDISPCPHCGLDIRAFWSGKDWIEKLILALEHPEPRTPIRAAWLLGEIGDTRAVPPLIDLFNRTKDIYIAQAAAQALTQMDDPAAQRFLRTLTEHPARMIREVISLTTMAETRDVSTSQGSIENKEQ